MVNKTDQVRPSAAANRYFNLYYGNDENNYHSLPRYFGGSLRRDREKSYTRSKSVVNFYSALKLNHQNQHYGNNHKNMEHFSSRSGLGHRHYGNDFDASRDNQFGAIIQNDSNKLYYHQSNKSDTGSELSYGNSNTKYSDHNNKHYLDLLDDDPNQLTENEYFARKSKKSSKFLRYSSLRSLKKFVNKLRGKKSFVLTGELGGPTAGGGYRRGEFVDSSFSANFIGPTGVPPTNNVNSSTNNRLTASTESGVNTPTDTLSWTNGRTTPVTLSATPVEMSTPALCGIANHGNTCYINAVVQCLSNTDVLAEYFLSNAYYSDLCQNQRNAEKYGSQGLATNGLAELIYSLWFKKYSAKISQHFKEIVEHCSRQYRGGQQQDAQEFFIWLLDRVHEDLNVAIKRRYKLNKARNKSEDEIACSAMEKHLEAHCSFISYHFHGLFLSSVTCPVCFKQSTQPDPFACVSLPVSQSTKKPLYVVMVYINRRPRLVKFGLNADITATFYEVKHCLSKATDIHIDQIVLCELGVNGFMQSFADDNDISCLNATKCIYAFETPLGNASEELICLVCNQIGEGSSGKRFGTPVALKLSREVSYGEMCRALFSAMKQQLVPTLFVQDIPANSFRLRVDDYHLLAYIPEDVSLPMYSQAVDNSLASQKKNTGPVHIKLMIEWTRDARDKVFNASEETIIEHKSAQDLKHQEAFPESQTLHECLEEFTKDESLQWYCPDCRKHQERAVKRTVFYWLPNILTLHLKRNKQLSNGQLVKLEPLVKFPVYGLNLADFMYQSTPGTPRRTRSSSNGFRSGGRLKSDELYIDTKASRCVYDLFAVCNHHGDSPNSGHYTAYCRNPVNGNWYSFDDQNVTRIDENRLVTNAAYMLFYERRMSRTANSCHNSTESGFVDHWYFRVYSSLFDQQMANNDNITKGSREKLEGIESASCTPATGVSSSRGSPERPQSRQMFVALPPVIGTTAASNDTCDDNGNKHKHEPTTSHNRTEPAVGRLVSIDTPPPSTSRNEFSEVKGQPQPQPSAVAASRQPKTGQSQDDTGSSLIEGAYQHQPRHHNRINGSPLEKGSRRISGVTLTPSDLGSLNSAHSSIEHRIRTNSLVETDL